MLINVNKYKYIIYTYCTYLLYKKVCCVICNKLLKLKIKNVCTNKYNESNLAIFILASNFCKAKGMQKLANSSTQVKLRAKFDANSSLVITLSSVYKIKNTL